MTTMVRFDPYRELTGLRDEMGRLFSRTFGEGASAWTPALDVIESKEAVLLQLDRPGLKAEQVEIEVHEGVLTVKGERRFENRVEEGRHHRLERSYGHFQRSLVLPKAVKADEITADFADGVLEIRVPKADEATPRRITVGAAA
jgi:HSP20 family protein